MRRLLAWLLGLALLGLLAWGLAVEPYWIEVREVEIADPFFGRALAGVKVVQLSDFHMDEPGRREAQVLRLLDRLKPDLLLLTGDYIRWEGETGPALGYLAGLKARLGVYGVLGGYDWSRPRRACLFCHQEGSGAPSGRGGARFLRGEGAVVAPNGIEVCIAGFDGGAWEGEGELEPPRIVRPTILLVHNPLIFDRVEADAPLLCLAGDTHGGQVRLPSALWRVLGRDNCARYREGLFRRGRSLLYVNRGIGTTHLRLRLFERPEVTVFRFVP